MEDCTGLISNAFFAGEGEDVDKLLQDEMLDSCDSPAIRKIVRSSFMAIFADLCKRIDEITAKFKQAKIEKPLGLWSSP